MLSKEALLEEMIRIADSADDTGNTVVANNIDKGIEYIKKDRYFDATVVVAKAVKSDADNVALAGIWDTMKGWFKPKPKPKPQLPMPQPNIGDSPQQSPKPTNMPRQPKVGDPTQQNPKPTGKPNWSTATGPVYFANNPGLMFPVIKAVQDNAHLLPPEFFSKLPQFIAFIKKAGGNKVAQFQEKVYQNRKDSIQRLIAQFFGTYGTERFSAAVIGSLEQAWNKEFKEIETFKLQGIQGEFEILEVGIDHFEVYQNNKRIDQATAKSREEAIEKASQFFKAPVQSDNEEILQSTNEDSQKFDSSVKDIPRQQNFDSAIQTKLKQNPNATEWTSHFPTESEVNDLVSKGYTQNEIAKMTPEQRAQAEAVTPGEPTNEPTNEISDTVVQQLLGMGYGFSEIDRMTPEQAKNAVNDIPADSGAIMYNGPQPASSHYDDNQAEVAIPYNENDPNYESLSDQEKFISGIKEGKDIDSLQQAYPRHGFEPEEIKQMMNAYKTKQPQAKPLYAPTSSHYNNDDGL